MIFENCKVHVSVPQNLIVLKEEKVECLCEECFHSENQVQESKGLIFNENLKIYFFKFNQYLIEQLSSIATIAQSSGLELFFEKFNNGNMNETYQNNQLWALNSAESKQIFKFVVDEHCNILRQNLNYLNQCRSQQDFRNPYFLKDLISATLSNIEQVLNPILLNFISILKSKMSIQLNLKWSRNVLENIEQIRSQIIKDWVSSNIIEQKGNKKYYSVSEQKQKTDQIFRLKTQQSFNRSSVSKDSDFFQDEDDQRGNQLFINAFETCNLKQQPERIVQKIQFQFSNQNTQQGTNTLDINTQPVQKDTNNQLDQSSVEQQIDNKDLRINYLQNQNQYLRQIIRQLQQQIELRKLQQFQAEDINRQLEQKYESLESQYLKVLDRVENIDLQINQVNQQMNKLNKENQEQIVYIHQLQIMKLDLQKQGLGDKRLIQQLKEQNTRLNLEVIQMQKNKKGLNYYINPFYESKKQNEQFLEQIVELEAQNMQKDEDIKKMIKVIEKTAAIMKNIVLNSSKSDFSYHRLVVKFNFQPIKVTKYSKIKDMKPRFFKEESNQSYRLFFSKQSV